MNEENNQKEIDWQRIHKALSIEAEYGYKNLKGSEYFFHEFLSLSLGKIPPLDNVIKYNRLQTITKSFSKYPQLDSQERQQLVSNTQVFLKEIQAIFNPLVNDSISLKTTSIKEYINKQNPYVKLNLNDNVDRLSEVSLRKKPLLEKLGLSTIRDVLFYYPRDHIDYARKVNICDLIAGETVTIIGKIKRCDCFTSPKNKKINHLKRTN